MKTVTIVILLLAFAIVSSASRANELGIAVRMPAYFEFDCSDMSNFDISVFDNAAERLELDGNLEVEIQEEESNHPATWLGFRQDLILTRDMFLYCHGADDGSLVLEHYLSAGYAESAYDSYVATFPNGGYFSLNSDRDAIFLRPSGIANLLAPGSDSNGNKLVFGCHSYVSKESWGDFSNYNSGGAFFGFPLTIGGAIACQDFDKMSRVMSCEDYSSTGFENDIYSAYKRSSGKGILSGNQNNSFNPAVSCKSWDIEFAAIEAWNGEIRFVIKDEERWSQYLIEGVDRIGDCPDTLAVLNGYGTDGEGVYRSYAKAVPQRHHLRIVAYDNCCLTTVSDWISWEKSPHTWSLMPGDELSLLPLKEMPGGGYSDGRVSVSSDENSIKEVEPADVVVYTTTGNESIANRIRGSWQMTTNSDGLAFRPRVYCGSEDPFIVRGLYRNVYLANQAYNAGHPETPYREFPILQIVGNSTSWTIDGETFRVGPNYFTWPDGEGGGCHDGIYRSYTLMADVDFDNVPDGPVVVLPLKSYEEAQIHADAVETFNQMPRDNGVLLALDDYYSGVASDWLEEESFGEFGAYASSRGLNLKGVLKESNWLPSEEDDINEQMAAAGTALINSGVSEVWYAGLSASYNEHTKFLESVPDWTTGQGFLLFGPTCNFGGADWPFGRRAICEEMFDNPNGGLVVGGIGQFSATYAHAHMKLAHLMQELLPQMPEGTLVVEAAFAIQQEFLQRFPELHEYGLGIHCVGSVAKLKAASVSGVGDDPCATLSAFGLRTFVMGTGTGLHFNLAKPLEATLHIYDIRGARIATLLHGENLSMGEHSLTWNGHGNGCQVASGTYFARLHAGGIAETVKFVFVK